MDLSIIIVSWNVKEYLEKCLESIFENPPQFDFEIIVVDNASTDKSSQMVKKKFPQVKLIENKENLGFAKANNQGIRESPGKYILLLNPDTVVLPGAIDKLIKFMEEHKETGVVAPKILNPDKTLQPSCLAFPTLSAMFVRAIFIEGLWPNNPITRYYLMKDFDFQSEAEVDQPMGAALMIRRAVLDQVGLFDEESFMFFDEVDLCFRIKKAGWKIYFTPRAEITHYMARSIKKWGIFNLSRHWTRSRNHYFYKHFGLGALLLLYLFDFLRLAIVIGILIGLGAIIWRII